MATYQDKQGTTFKTRAEAKQSNLSLSTGSPHPNATTANDLVANAKPITASALTSQPQFDIPNYNSPSSVGGTLAGLEENQFIETVQDTRNSAFDSMNASLGEYANFLLSAPTKESLTADIYAKEGVNQSKAERDRIKTRILAEQTSLRHQQEDIDAKGGGLASGALSEKSNLERDSLRKQADLAVTWHMFNDDYESAKAVADDAIDSIYADVQRQIDFRKEILTRNQKLFDDKELQLFNARLKEEENRVIDERDEKKALQTAKLEAIKMARTNGAPAGIISAIQSADTPEDVFNVAGQWGSVDMLDRAYKAEQLKSLRSKPEALVPTDVIDQGGRKLLVNTQTGEVIKDFGVSDVSLDELRMAVTEQQVKQVDDLKAHKGLNSAVGPTFLTRTGFADSFGAKDDFIASVDQLTKDLTLEKLITAKGSGATFGALSEGELRLLSDAATKINNWRMEEDGTTTGFDASQGDFMEELDLISNYRKLDAVLKGVPPENVGVQVKDDGSYWAMNGDGSLTRIR